MVVDERYYVGDGPCGFAWVTVKPGTSSFAKWLVKQGYASKAYGGGVQIWISEHNQSLERKTAHARVMAERLREYGFKAYSNSRID